MKRIESGEYEGMIDGQAVRVYRTGIGYNAYGQRSNTQTWTVALVNPPSPAARILADGGGSKKQVIESARLALQVRAAAK